MDETLMGLEEAGWQALSSDQGAEFYRQHLTDDALVVVPGMVIDRTTFLQALQSDAQPWAAHRIEEARVVQFTPDCAAVVYRAVARREGQLTFCSKTPVTGSFEQKLGTPGVSLPFTADLKPRPRGACGADS